MGKNDYLKPTIEDLRPGNKLPIFSDYLNQENFEGNAELLESLPGWRPPFIYVRTEVGQHTINWSYQRWRVEFMDGPKKGFVTARLIAYFVNIQSD